MAFAYEVTDVALVHAHQNSALAMQPVKYSCQMVPVCEILSSFLHSCTLIRVLACAFMSCLYLTLA